MGLPLLLHQAAEARRLAFRALAAAALPMLMLTIFFTISRAGIAAAAIAIGIYLVFAGDRLPKLLTTLVAVIGGAVLVVAATATRRSATGSRTAMPTIRRTRCCC